MIPANNKADRTETQISKIATSRLVVIERSRSLASLVTPDTVLMSHRELIAKVGVRITAPRTPRGAGWKRAAHGRQNPETRRHPAKPRAPELHACRAHVLGSMPYRDDAFPNDASPL